MEVIVKAVLSPWSHGRRGAPASRSIPVYVLELHVNSDGMNQFSLILGRGLDLIIYTNDFPLHITYHLLLNNEK